LRVILRRGRPIHDNRKSAGLAGMIQADRGTTPGWFAKPHQALVDDDPRYPSLETSFSLKGIEIPKCREISWLNGVQELVLRSQDPRATPIKEK
jgi:hypothetical protein